jgi:MFS family permease
MSHGLGDAAGHAATFICITLGFLGIRYFGQGILTLAARTMLMKWFVKYRGRMNSVVSVSMSLAFSLSPLVFYALIQRYSWRGTWVIMAVAVGVLFAVFAAIFYRDTPEKYGLKPDGESLHSDEVKNSRIEESWTLGQAKRTYAFWVFNIGLGLFAFYYTAFTFHIISIFDVAGHPEEYAVSIFLPASVIAVCISILAGWLSDMSWFRNHMKYFLIVFLSGICINALSILFLSTTPVARLVIILGNGISSGLFGTLTAVTWPTFFGRQHLGEITGYNMWILVMGSALGPVLFGASFSAAGNYIWAVIISAIIAMTLMLFSLKANRPEWKHVVNR